VIFLRSESIIVKRIRYITHCFSAFEGHVIRGGGALVLGQEQDSFGGSFSANQCFLGEMTGVNIWDHVIGEQEIKCMSKSCLAGVGNVFQWRDFKPHLKGSVEQIKPSC